MVHGKKSGKQAKKAVEIPTDTMLAFDPLSDPMVSATFQNVELAGLAAESLLSALYKPSFGEPLFGKVISVTPQGYHGKPYERGCRVDVEIRTDSNEWLIIEVQLGVDRAIMERNMLASSKIISETSAIGDTHREMANRMPKMIFFNILDYDIRDDNKEVFQPVELVFIKEPVRTAVKNLKIINVQLPRLDEAKPAFDQDWYCWLYALYTAHKNKQTLREVVGMSASLQAFAERNPGFRQYYEQYERASASPEVKSAYYDWYASYMREMGMLESVRQDRDEYWRAIVAGKDNLLADKDNLLADKDNLLADKDNLLAEAHAERERQAAQIAEAHAEREHQVAQIAELTAKLAALEKQ